ncbi:MAG: aminotransferase class III-fold pyridoxal phosphate-dependent enzyme [Candidatus Eisenbacteria bacterium]|nr:aminotransferase class III-fold pyridoxal phosphate-dependent enzyme [Candidatus Eisenbacteria bacterium]
MWRFATRVARNRDDIAAIILEPIQGEGGDNHFRAEFFQALRQLADEHEFLFIVDEVQTGVGLTGQWWAHQNYGVKPGPLDLRQEDAGLEACSPARAPLTRPRLTSFGSRAGSTHLGRQPDRHGPARLYLEIIQEEKLIDHARTEGALPDRAAVLDAGRDARRLRQRPRAGALLRPRSPPPTDRKSGCSTPPGRRA